MATSNTINSAAATRYAGALLDLTEESKSLKKVEKDIKTVAALFEKNADLRDMASSPVFAIEDKIKAILAVATKAKIGPLVKKFLGTVIQNHRAHEIPAMTVAFAEMLAERRGSQVAKVVSAKKLTAAQLSQIKRELKSALGQVVDIETHIDPTLLGGFVVHIGSRLYDSSLKTKIEDLKLALKEA